MREQDLPWLAGNIEAFDKTLKGGRFPHALLITGPEGVGKVILAEILAQRLLCLAPADPPCGNCQACVLYRVGNHPDYYEVRVPEEKNSIGVDQVRALSANLGLTSNLGGRRVSIISPADFMTVAAANSLLKTLEEPPQGTVLVLVSARPARLPATVRSRCQRVQVACPPPEQALHWLQNREAGINWQSLLTLASGAPLKAAELQKLGFDKLDATLSADLVALTTGADNPLDVAKRWEKTGSHRCVEWLQASARTLALAHAAGTDVSRDLQKAGENINLGCLLDYARELAEARSLLDSPANKLLVLERILIPWSGKLTKPSNMQQAETL